MINKAKAISRKTNKIQPHSLLVPTHKLDHGVERLPGGDIAADHELDQRLAQPAAVAQAVHPRQAGVGRRQLREGGYYMGSLMGLSDL